MKITKSQRKLRTYQGLEEIMAFLKDNRQNIQFWPFSWATRIRGCVNIGAFLFPIFTLQTIAGFITNWRRKGGGGVMSLFFRLFWAFWEIHLVPPAMQKKCEITVCSRSLKDVWKMSERYAKRALKIINEFDRITRIFKEDKIWPCARVFALFSLFAHWDKKS